MQRDLQEADYKSGHSAWVSRLVVGAGQPCAQRYDRWCGDRRGHRHRVRIRSRARQLRLRTIVHRRILLSVTAGRRDLRVAGRAGGIAGGLAHATLGAALAMTMKLVVRASAVARDEHAFDRIVFVTP